MALWDIFVLNCICLQFIQILARISHSFLLLASVIHCMEDVTEFAQQLFTPGRKDTGCYQYFAIIFQDKCHNSFYIDFFKCLLYIAHKLINFTAIVRGKDLTAEDVLILFKYKIMSCRLSLRQNLLSMCPQHEDAAEFIQLILICRKQFCNYERLAVIIIMKLREFVNVSKDFPM